MAHVRVFGAAAPAAKGIIHWGATSAYVTDNADLIQMRDGARAARAPARRGPEPLARLRARPPRPARSRLHALPAGAAHDGRQARRAVGSDLLLRPRGDPRGARGPAVPRRQGRHRDAGLLPALFDGDSAKVEELDRALARRAGFEQRADRLGPDLLAQAGRPRRARALRRSRSRRTRSATDLRLLQHEGEIEEPFETSQVGSSAMPYKRNPMRAERICSLARHVIVALARHGHDRRDAVARAHARRLGQQAHRGARGVPRGRRDPDPARERRGRPGRPSRGLRAAGWPTRLPFLATENMLMEAVRRGGDRQELHERLPRPRPGLVREALADGGPADLLERIASDAAFGLTSGDVRGRGPSREARSAAPPSRWRSSCARSSIRRWPAPRASESAPVRV